MKDDQKKNQADIAEQVKLFLRTVELRQVFLKGIFADCYVPSPSIIVEETKTTVNQESSFLRQDGVLVVLSKITFQGHSGKNKVFEFQQVLALVYGCDHKSFSDGTLKMFAEKNGTYNAWPYHRELLQSTMGRMGLPPYILPLLNPYRPLPKLKEKKRRKITGKTKQTVI